MTKKFSPAFPVTIIQAANGYIVMPEYMGRSSPVEWSAVHVFGTLAEVYAWLKAQEEAAG